MRITKRENHIVNCDSWYADAKSNPGKSYSEEELAIIIYNHEGTIIEICRFCKKIITEKEEEI